MFVGEVILWAGELSPGNLKRMKRRGLMPCDGRLLSETKYPELFLVVQDNFRQSGETFPPGQFRIPDLRGRVPMGAGKGSSTTDRILGNYLGAETVRLEVHHLPPHSHSYVFSSGKNSPHHVDVSPNEFGIKDKPNEQTGNTGGHVPHDNVQPSVVLNYLIRFKIAKALETAMDLADDEMPED